MIIDNFYMQFCHLELEQIKVVDYLWLQLRCLLYTVQGSASAVPYF